MGLIARGQITIANVKDGQNGISYWRSQQTIDLSNTAIYDANKWYPVTGTQLLTTAYNRILVYVALNSGTKPLWSTHGSGFSVNFDIASLGSGWGTTSAETIIYGDTFSYCSVSPASYTQLTNSSTPVLYLRGGGKYYVKTDYVCTWTPRSTDFVHTVTSGGNTYTQSAPVLNSRPIPVGRNIKGPQGPQGIQGPKGADGASSYFHIRYSQNANGDPMSDSAVNAIYIGTCSTTSSTAPTAYSSYKWSKIKGETGNTGPKGDTGVAGPAGANGKTSYLHIKYSDDGTSFTANNGETPGKYIGTYVDFVEADSITFSKYGWVKIEGPQGIQGPKGADGKTYYTWLKYADSPTSGMSDSPTGKSYIGLAYNKLTATESSTYSDYTWSMIKGEKGNTGIQGPKGADGKTYYTWIKYATSASGANMSDSPAGKTYIGLAYNKATSVESTIASDYTWSLIKGDKGDKGDDGTVHSDTEPTDKTKLWLDTSLEPPLLKYWDGTSWETANDSAGDINDVKQTITNEYTTAINDLKTALTSLVEGVQTTTTDNTILIDNLSSQIAQHTDSITLVTSSVKSMTNTLTGMATKQEISQWARFQDGVLELGASNSPFAVKLSNSELGFYQNESRIAYLSNQQLNIEFAIVMSKINIGIFNWTYNPTEGLTLT